MWYVIMLYVIINNMVCNYVICNGYTTLLYGIQSLCIAFSDMF